MLTAINKLFKEKIRSNLGKDIGITLAAQLGIMLLSLVVNKLLSNMLGVDGYGQYSIIKKSTSVLSFIMLSGMGIALPRYLSTYLTTKDLKNAKSAVVSSILVILIVSLVVITGCVLFKNQLGTLIVGNDDLKLYFSAIFFAFSVTTSSLLFAYYRGANAFIYFNISQIAIQLIITFCAVFYGNNLFLVLNLWSVATIVFVFLSLFNERSRNPLFRNNPLHWDQHIAKQLKILFKYGIPRLIGDFFLFSFAAFPLIFISQKIGIKSSSYFATGLTLVSIATPFFSFLGMILLPYVSSSIAQNNFKQVDKLIGKLTLLYLVLSIIAILFLWFGIDIFINLFFSKEFLPSANISRILILTILFESIYLLLRNPIDAVSNIPYNTLNLLVSFLILIALFLNSTSLENYAASFLAVSVLKSGISFFTWQYCRKNIKAKMLINHASKE